MNRRTWTCVIECFRAYLTADLWESWQDENAEEREVSAARSIIPSLSCTCQQGKKGCTLWKVILQILGATIVQTFSWQLWFHPNLPRNSKTKRSSSPIRSCWLWGCQPQSAESSFKSNPRVFPFFLAVRASFNTSISTSKDAWSDSAKWLEGNCSVAAGVLGAGKWSVFLWSKSPLWSFVSPSPG